MSIMVNKKVFYDYFVEEKFEVGIVFEGWEVKVICVGWMNIKEFYVIIKGGEIFLIGMYILLLFIVLIYNVYDFVWICKLLLYGREIMKLIGKVECFGYVLVLIDLYFCCGWIKFEIGLVKGKK